MTIEATSHRIVVLGGGYTGIMAAIRAAKRTRRHGGRVTLVNPSSRFNERLRMHQQATAQEMEHLEIPDLLKGMDIEFVEGFATDLDPVRQGVSVATEQGSTTVHYETLIYAIGSATPTTQMPGVDVHAYTLNSPASAKRFAGRLAEVDTGTVVVCGNGLTGVEAATEIAESFPSVRVVLVGRDVPAPQMNTKARSYLLDVLERLGIESRTGVEITKVLPDAVELAGGELIASDATLWTTGFWASPLAADSGITVDPHRRIVVDSELRSVSHPSIFAIGDAAAIQQPWGVIHGTCQSGMPSGAHAADNIGRLLRGKTPKPFGFGYLHQPVSLGRNDAVVQFTKVDDSPSRWYLTGRSAVRYKETVTGSPSTTYGLSRRFVIPMALLARKGPRRVPRRPAISGPQ
ncbi:FAD-dependent oxidoreductase [Nocardioides sp. InS609-2]|uniref:NAD(P)/FAD-dependent oxidoreductase n=1 Tax=Nocardioides sp. InS609-2 TaxID=2760705 RepID=UPI0024A7845F|nr:FAD-dependent oxidoreductase [Nocardioides sp. InS609-2]